MKTFISASDIETLAAGGVRELTVDEDTVLTAVAREAAARLGVKLVAPGAKTGTGVVTGAAASAGANGGRGDPAPTNPAKPRGCQHGPLSVGAGASASQTSSRPTSVSVGGPIVDELIGAVKQLARK